MRSTRRRQTRPALLILRSPLNPVNGAAEVPDGRPLSQPKVIPMEAGSPVAIVENPIPKPALRA